MGRGRTWSLSPSSDRLTPEQLGIRSGGVCFILSHSVPSVAPPPHCPSTQHNTTQPLWPHTNQPNLCVVPSGSSPMSHLMGRSNRQGDSSTGGTPALFCFHHIELPVPGCISPSPPPPSPTGSAWHGSPGFHELKAKVTEVPAPEISQDNTGLHHTPVAHHHHRFSEPKIIQSCFIHECSSVSSKLLIN